MGFESSFFNMNGAAAVQFLIVIALVFVGAICMAVIVAKKQKEKSSSSSAPKISPSKKTLQK